ncbi:IclR family transcriptional regulator [Dactylosporangium fulvum]|uniref:Helix-turn-helix domain-containing protein n=1 Tax=Dactylosporangium fulvum TaxID=53359 RepID=A0ABY5VUQ1_9ACTN|nr:helix-turn-helix domain-containing protein [Dactylosporangium fulvum]UWP80218.1 helix-turn-helix domain-containing protein [Dactylosporangium fulvum]
MSNEVKGVVAHEVAHKEGTRMSSVKRIQAVQNACQVFEAVAALAPVGVSELARETGLDKSGVHRIAVTLHEAGWLQPTADRPTRWLLGSKILEIARSAALTQTIERARGAIRALSDSTGETVLLVAAQGGRLVVVDVADSAATVASMARIGDVMPPHGASTSAWYGALPVGATSAAVVAPADELDAEMIAAARRRGYAVSSARDVTSIGAAVLDASGTPSAVLVVLTPDFRISARRVSQFGKLVRAAAESISGG